MKSYENMIGMERPAHNQDDFSLRHPPMPREKRAKLFAPFDALTGYDEALAEQEIIYQDREELSEERRLDLDAKLDHLLHIYRERKSGTKYTGGDHAAQVFEPPVITIEFFEEIPGQNGRGLYHTCSGAVIKLDLSRRCLLLAQETRAEPVCVPLRDIVQYSGEIFDDIND